MEKKYTRAIHTFLPKIFLNWLLTRFTTPRMMDSVLSYKFKIKKLKTA